MNKNLRWGLVGLCWITAVLRTRSLFLNHFHADEALYASWARHIAVWRDPLLLTQAVDKPPLLFYLQALFYPLQGPVEWAARLPNYIASLLLVPLVGIFVWRLFRRWQTAVFGAALVAFSPLHIQFSASAFTDPLLTTFLFASLVCQAPVDPANRRPASFPGRPFISGLLFGLAILTKHQAWLFLPLLLGLGFIWGWRREWLAWGQGFGPLLLLGWGWELLRNGRLTLIASQVDNVGGFGLVPPSELGERLLTWIKLGQFGLHPGWVGLIALGLLGIGIFQRDSFGRRGDHEALDEDPVMQAKTETQRRLKVYFRPGEIDAPAAPARLWLWSVLIFGLGYATLHLLLDIPVWERYLLPLVPLSAVLLAGGLNILFKACKSQKDINVGFILFSVLFMIGFIGVSLATVFTGVAAQNGRFPIGARPFADSGAANAAATLANEPYGTVLYDHWYSWQWQYHLFDKKVHLNWFPDEMILIEDLNAFFDDVNRRYLVLPRDERGDAVAQAVEAAGFLLVPMAIEGESAMILYRIEK